MAMPNRKNVPADFPPPWSKDHHVLPADPVKAIAMLTELAGPNGSVAIFSSAESEAEEAVNAVASGVAETTVEDFIESAKRNIEGDRNVFVVVRVGRMVTTTTLQAGLA